MAAPRFDPVSQPGRISSYWKREWKVAAAIVFFGVAFNGSMSAGPILQGRLIDTLVAHSPMRTVALQAGLFAGTILLIQVMRYFKRYYVRLFANRTAASLRLLIYRSIMRRNLSELSGENAGDLMAKAVSDVDICTEGMRKVTTEIFDTGVLMLSYLVSLLIYDWKITAAACVFIPAAVLLAGRLKGIVVRYSKAARAQNSIVSHRIYESVAHAVLLRVNGLEEKDRDGCFRELDELETRSVKANILENSMQPVYGAIAVLGVAALLYRGGMNVISGDWTVGMLSAYLVLFSALAAKAGKTAKLFHSYQKASVSWERIRPYLTDDPEYTGNSRDSKGYKDSKDYGDSKDCRDYKDYKDSINCKDYTDSKGSGRQGDGSLVVSDLCFHYPGSDTDAIQGVNFSARPGEIIGITGPVACGKSSLGAVLQGIYPYAGSILLDGRELRDYSQRELCSRISLLEHDPQLLSDTIYNNITLGDDGDIEAVLRDVCFDEDLKAMPEGIHTMVGIGGVRLSGGQQSRIALARALYRRSPLLILDDPFSSVDPGTGRRMIANLRSHYPGSIILLISHRLSIFPEADRILVIHGDHRAEYGTHDALMSSSSLYSSVYRLQTGGESDET